MSKIAIIGIGKMGGAFFAGLRNTFAEENLFACDQDQGKLAALGAKNISTDPSKTVNQVEVVILAVKPQSFGTLAQEINTDLTNKLIISIMAGVSTKKLQKSLKTNKVVRSMPNLGTQVDKSITVWFATDEVGDQEKKLVKKIFTSLGTEFEIDEEAKLDAITALSGSGPAYFFHLCELLEEKAKELGFNEEDSRKLAETTFVGSAKLLEENTLSSAEWRKAVTSSGGTTEAALNHMEERGFSEIFKEAVEKAKERSKDLDS